MWKTVDHDLQVYDETQEFHSKIKLTSIKKDEKAQRLLQQADEFPKMLRLMGVHTWSMLTHRYQFEMDGWTRSTTIYAEDEHVLEGWTANYGQAGRSSKTPGDDGMDEDYNVGEGQGGLTGDVDDE